MKELLRIGTIESVSLPDDQISGIPAKVDTGADKSSIWASNVRLHGGKLKFNFFAPGSVFYHEKPVVSTVFRTTTVRNSFGHKEFRYKIKLTVKIGNHALTRWFTLADRSHNTYPVLLGKNFLKNKFIVDVSQKNLIGGLSETNKVLIFTKYPEEVGDFLEKAKLHNEVPLTYECADYDELVYHIDGAATQVINTQTQEDLANYSFTYFKNTHDREFAAAAAEYLNYKSRPFANHEFSDYMSGSKLSEYMRLNCYGLAVPQTFCAKTALLKSRYAELMTKLGLPFVLKEIRSDKGKNNYLVQKQQDFDDILKAAPADYDYLAQQYIENDGFYRIYVMGKEVDLAIWRSPSAHKNRLKTHLNKPAGSANATNVPLNDVAGEAQDLALGAANCLNRQIAGVDLLQDKVTGKWYILEVNNDPQIRSGSFVNDKAAMVAKYFERELNQ